MIHQCFRPDMTADAGHDAGHGCFGSHEAIKLTPDMTPDMAESRNTNSASVCGIDGGHLRPASMVDMSGVKVDERRTWAPLKGPCPSGVKSLSSRQQLNWRSV